MIEQRARWGGLGGWGVRRLASWQNPVVASPVAPLESFAALDALASG
jgi:hypothetical protein